MMRRLVLFLCLVFITLNVVFSAMTEKQLSATKKLIRNTCLNKAKPTSEQVDGLQKGDFPDDKNVQPDLNKYGKKCMDMLPTFTVCTGTVGLHPSESLRPVVLLYTSAKNICYTYCVLSTYKLIRKDNSFDWQGGIAALEANAPASIAGPGAKTIENCKDAVKTTTDKCLASYEIAKCIYDDNPSNYFIP